MYICIYIAGCCDYPPPLLYIDTSISQYAVEETNEEGGGAQTAATAGETHNVAGETSLHKDKGDAASQNPQEGKVFVGGISWQTTEETLQYYFQRFGEVADVVLMRDKITGNPR